MAACKLCGGAKTIQVVQTVKRPGKTQPTVVIKTVRCPRCRGSGREPG